jgi:heme/copper-type cytochrome/quinol oxidase subunit 2
MKTCNISFIIFVVIYIITFLIYLKSAYKMHKENDSDDPFYGSHIVVALCFIGLIPIVNILVGIFISSVNYLENSKRKLNK